MKVKCEYCDAFIDDTADFCPNCGGVNANVMRSSDGIPKTIEELKAFCNAKGMDLPRMRFFIGENYTQPKAYGIYRDGEIVVVYKNKSDGSRAIRYRGTDEAYAVNEIYQKLWSEVQTRRAQDIAGPAPTPVQSTPVHTSSPSKVANGCISFIFTKVGSIILILFVLSIGSCMARCNTDGVSFYPSDYSGYYSSGYDDSGSGSSNYSSGSGSSWDSDWDSGSWDYDYGSWDSSGSDWGSDWLIW